MRRSLVNIQILLPLGTEDGQYTLQFSDRGGEITVKTTGTAIFDGTNETLAARVDLRTIESGQYTLAIRRGTSSWHQYSVIVD